MIRKMEKAEILAKANSQMERLLLHLQEHLELANAHMTDFFTADHWNHFISPSWQKDLLKLSDKELCDVASEATPQTVEMSTDCDSLYNYFLQCRTLWLDNCNFLKSEKDLYTNLGIDQVKSLYISEFMNEKKSHEVDKMASLCACLARSQHIKQVVDVGSGRGYLGSQLSMMYQLQVLGVDCSQINTKSAERRNRLIAKHWNGVTRKAQHRDSLSPKQPIEPQDSTALAGETSMPPVHDSAEEKLITTDATELNKQISCKTNELYVPVTEYITKKTDLLQLIQHGFSELNLSKKTSDCEDATSDSRREPCGGATALESPQKLLLSGLHTCGNLAPNLIKIFQANEHIKVLCNVGCCYNHLTEQFVPDDNVSGDDNFGFPMSEYLKSRSFSLGKNARMLACQSPQRTSANVKLPGESLHWRAVLQVLLSDTVAGSTESTKKQWRIGKIASKSKNFLDYVQRSCTKLDIKPFPTEEGISGYEATYAAGYRKVQAFHQVRAALAPCIEAIILLDRLAFMLQQDVIQADLVQLFDDVKSPRCWCLVVLK